MAQPADPIRRPAPVTPTSPIAASSSAAIGGSVWPTRSGSVPPVLDTTGSSLPSPFASMKAIKAPASAGVVLRLLVTSRAGCRTSIHLLPASRLVSVAGPVTRTTEALGVDPQARHVATRTRRARMFRGSRETMETVILRDTASPSAGKSCCRSTGCRTFRTWSSRRGSQVPGPRLSTRNSRAPLGIRSSRRRPPHPRCPWRTPTERRPG